MKYEYHFLKLNLEGERIRWNVACVIDPPVSILKEVNNIKIHMKSLECKQECNQKTRRELKL